MAAQHRAVTANIDQNVQNFTGLMRRHGISPLPYFITVDPTAKIPDRQYRRHNEGWVLTPYDQVYGDIGQLLNTDGELYVCGPVKRGDGSEPFGSGLYVDSHNNTLEGAHRNRAGLFSNLGEDMLAIAAIRLIHQGM